MVSGYVSVCTGRARGTEDVDILFPVPGREVFRALFEDLTKNGFWCYQTDNAEEAYGYVKNRSKTNQPYTPQYNMGSPGFEPGPQGPKPRIIAECGFRRSSLTKLDYEPLLLCTLI